ncbi:KH domain-containing protein [Myxococcota bacterium]|nr:KH domain-containing protein [Myxococcota bacterium]
MKALVEYLAKALVENPEEVDVQDVGDAETKSVFELRVAASDRGRVIGKNGRTAHAIRSLLAAATKDDKEAPSLEIID